MNGITGWLEALALGQYAKTFSDNAITWDYDDK